MTLRITNLDISMNEPRELADHMLNTDIRIRCTILVEVISID